MTDLRCGRCGESKPTDCFTPQRNCARGFTSFCKPCNAAYGRERYARPEVRAKAVAASRAYRSDPANKAAKAAYGREYRLRNIERARELDANPEKRERDRARAKTPRGRALKVASFHRRRARLLGNGGDGVTTEQWAEVVASFNGTCAYCLAQVPLTMDHIVPLSSGGEHDLSNVVPACGPCNFSKSTKSLLDFMLSRPR